MAIAISNQPVDDGNTPATRRKSSVTAAALEKARHDKVEIVEDIALLSEEDRRLAELGYIAA